MASNNRTHVSEDMPSSVQGLVPKHLAKQEFAKRLYHLMVKKGWTQSELGRAADVPRDSISVYMRGKSLPTAQNVEKLAKVLGVSPTELLPNHVESAIDSDTPALEIKVSPNAPSKAWLRVNQLVSFSTATKVAQLLQDDAAPTKSNAPADGD